MSFLRSKWAELIFALDARPDSVETQVMDQKRKNLFLLVAAVLLLVLVPITLLGVQKVLVATGLTAGADQKFGDQHLKTTVALVELHKLRYGKYPASLKDLKFVGDWDLIALARTTYSCNANRSAYYVGVDVGWVGKPNLEMPAEFWQGTGYDPSLKPAS